MKFSPDGESEIIRVADSEIVPVSTVKLPPHGGGSDEEWQPQGQRKGNTLLPEAAISPAPHEPISPGASRISLCL